MTEQIRSADYLVNTVLNTPGAIEKLQQQPAETLKQFATQATQDVPRVIDDKLVYRIVVYSLGIAVNAVILGTIAMVIIYMSSENQIELKIPDILTAMGSAAIGALAGLLAPSPAAQRATP